ncbi:MAG: IQ calmodulin-binding motif-containing protein [Chlamydiales bacterium]|nr:IQ calmodulin-binding motif-containing protein [Chlamydiales bacterium]
MINKLLITFTRDSNLETNADLGEKIGNFGLGLLRVGFGKTITVEKISGGADKITFTEKAYSTSAKVAAVALFILAFPVTIPLSGIGYIGTACSKSHEQIFNTYAQNIQSVPNQINGNIHQQNAIPVIHPNTPKDKAAATIQKHFRGYLARKPHLPSNLYPQYRVQCEKVKGPESHSIPQADGGKTTVYLPQEMPGVVLKSSGRKDAITRFHQMQEIRSILNSQNSSHLIIPKANLCKEFLVEERLPINVDSYHNMGLYLSQPELFDEAVRELTRLFSRVYLSDLVSYQLNPLGHIAGVEDFVRYDNLPMYVVEENGKKKGKIGLIDLEHMQKDPNSQDLETLVRIFPLHLNVIKNEANKLNMKVNKGSLDASAEMGRKYLQVGFIDHLNWLKQKGVSTR